MKIRPKTNRLKITLLVFSAVAVALGILTALILFFPTGSYEPVIVRGPGAVSFSNFPSSTTSSSASNASTTPISMIPGNFASEYPPPYPVTWAEGHETFSITGAAFQGNQITFSLAIEMSSVSECVPANLRLVTDESGTLEPPSSPAGSTFTFPDTQNCGGTPGATYSQSVTFAVGPSVAVPFLFTTGGASNVFFTVATDTAGSVDVALPSRSG
ncbi:MAG: hypothetical protein ABSC29_02325 [Minisyncoccia bacterium]|jgi:hypothetical protein